MILEMKIAERIRDNFNKGFFGKSMAIPELPKEYPAWTLKESGWIGVAVPIDHYFEFVESFAEVHLITERDVIIDSRSYDLLILACNSMPLRNEFAVICENFVDPGTDGSARSLLINSPAKWWNNWKNLLGNKAQTKEPYAVLGELLMLEKLLQSGDNAKWSGADHSTHDIESDNYSVEVKSTTSRYGYEVTISSVYQLRPADNKSLFLSYIRFERSELGLNINDVVKSLQGLGVNMEELESKLAGMGLERGRTAREKKYKVIEWKRYAVDECFPSITESSFKDGSLPRSIVRVNYTIDLSGLQGKSLL